jgi:5-methyltetrahydrofolate--homocysteine methyltransferase
LYNQAQAMLKDMIENNRFDARAVFGLYPAQRTGADTVSVFDETGQNVTHTFEHFVSNLTKSQANRIYL